MLGTCIAVMIELTLPAACTVTNPTSAAAENGSYIARFMARYTAVT
jgi:hypothetical protein